MFMFASSYLLVIVIDLLSRGPTTRVGLFVTAAKHSTVRDKGVSTESLPVIRSDSNRDTDIIITFLTTKKKKELT